MKLRTLLVAACLALVSASCAISRDADLVGSTDLSTDTTSESADAEPTDDEPTDDVIPVPTTIAPIPATTAPDGDVAVTLAFADGEMVEVLHGALNDVVVPSQENQEFVDLVYQGQVPVGFNAIVLSQTIVGEALDNQLAAADAAPSNEDTELAVQQLVEQLQTLLITADDPAAEAERLYNEVPYLQFIVGLQARQLALSNALAADAPADAGNPCVRHILVETEGEADEIVAELAGGADFGELAMERSTGPSGPSGGVLPCAPSSNYVAEFAEAVDSAEIGEYVGPVQTQFGWHVLVIDSYEADGTALAQTALTGSLETAEIEVDERVGVWDAVQLAVVPGAG